MTSPQFPRMNPIGKVDQFGVPDEYTGRVYTILPVADEPIYCSIRHERRCVRANLMKSMHGYDVCNHFKCWERIITSNEWIWSTHLMRVVRSDWGKLELNLHNFSKNIRLRIKSAFTVFFYVPTIVPLACSFYSPPSDPSPNLLYLILYCQNTKKKHSGIEFCNLLQFLYVALPVSGRYSLLKGSDVYFFKIFSTLH